MHIFFVGIGGIGTSALAQLCVHLGYRASGSDAVDSPLLQKLREKNIHICVGHNEKNIPSEIDLLVYSEAISSDNPERQYATEKNIPQKSYFEYLGEISANYRVIAVAGTHGKTTTTGLIAAGFQSGGFDATVIVGSELEIFNGNFHAGTNGWLLVEACEYRKNFRFLSPEILLITNVEWDHLDSFPNESDYYAAFNALVKKSKNVLYNGKNKDFTILLQQNTTKNIFVDVGGKLPFVPQISGICNVENINMTLGLSSFLQQYCNTMQYYCNNKKFNKTLFIEGVKNYRGAARRQEFLGTINDRKIFSDYAHHPTEIQAVAQIFREKFPQVPLAVAFEPHQYSRTAHFFTEFSESLALFDHVALFPIYAARDTKADKTSISSEDFLHQHTDWFLLTYDKKAIGRWMQSLPNEAIIIFMGAGKVDKIARNQMDILSFG